MTGSLFKSVRWFRLPILAAVLALAACGQGPFSPQARQTDQDRDQYLQLLESRLVSDQTFVWDTLSSGLIVRALPYVPRISQAATIRFADDRTFASETADWFQAAGRGRSRPLIILFGLHARDLTENDVTKLARFRPELRAPDGRLLAPAEMKRYGRDHVFIRDHFPVFNPWEEVFRLKFQPPSGELSGPWEFRLHWPGGVQTLPLGDLSH